MQTAIIDVGQKKALKEKLSFIENKNNEVPFTDRIWEMSGWMFSWFSYTAWL